MRYAVLIVLLLGSCQLFESRDMQPVADLAQQQYTVNEDFAQGWSAVLQKAQVDAAVKAKLEVQVETFLEKSAGYRDALLEFADKAGQVDWRGLYQQIKGAVKP